MDLQDEISLSKGVLVNVSGSPRSKCNVVKSGGDFKGKASGNVVKDKATDVVVKDKAPVVVKDRAALDNPKPTANVVKDKVPNDNVVNDKVPVLVKDKTMTVVKDYDNPRIS
ncbi:hypothetical protein Tco_1537059, partial [Tanacetum coccineum]